MTYQETETIELKLIVTEGLIKEIVAFANCDGGIIYIGVSDSGQVIGVPNPDSTALQISNMIRDSIKPDITMFVHYKTLKKEDKNIVEVSVKKGTHRPYYIAKKGLRPEGVYVRQGFSSVPATDTAIRQMIKETDDDSFEEMRSVNQALSFENVKKEFESRNIEFKESQLRTLKLISNDELYTNLALLLSDQCMQSIKVAVFAGTTQTEFRDRKEFNGSILKQMVDVYEYIDFRNQTNARFDKLRRIDTRDYPEVAIREALLNTIVHRDYSFSSSTLISIYADRIEFVSLGGLLPGLELNDILLGISVCRNPNLANVFYRLKLIEAYGTGIKKIMASYENFSIKPKIETSSHAFKITLPNRNEEKTETAEKISYPETNEEKVLQYLTKSRTITRSNVQEILGLSQTPAGKILRKMTEDGLLVREGGSRNTRYKIKKAT